MTALKSIETEFGVSIKRGNGSFSPNSFSLKIEAAVIGQDGKVQNKEAEAFKLFAPSCELKPSDLGRTFKDFSGKEYEITGFATRSYQYPILAKETKPNGRVFKFPAAQVKLGLEKLDLLTK
jgi:hypothetical protein